MPRYKSYEPWSNFDLGDSLIISVISDLSPEQEYTVISTVVLELPPSFFFAVIVYVVTLFDSVGVPEIFPFCVSIARPSGSSGETVKS